MDGGYLSHVSEQHIEASAAALSEVCRLVTTSDPRSSTVPLDVRIGHYDHGAFLTLGLHGFALLDTTVDGRLVPVGEGGEVVYAVVVNKPVEEEVSQTLTFLASLIERQSASRQVLGSGQAGNIDLAVTAVDQEVATALTERLRTEHWRRVATSVGERARAAGLPLRVRFANPLLEAEEIRRRVPVLRHVYNSLDSVRAAIDRVCAAMSRSLTVRGTGVPASLLAQAQDLLDLGQVRRYVAHQVRDTFVCGNGYIAFGEPQPSVQLLQPELVDIVGPDQFALLGPVRTKLDQKVLHLKGAHQVNSQYGLSLLEPFVLLLGQREVIQKAIEDVSNFKPSAARDKWIEQTNELLERVVGEQERRIEILLGGSTRGFPAAQTDLYFPGLQRMSPSVERLSFVERTAGSS